MRFRSLVVASSLFLPMVLVGAAQTSKGILSGIAYDSTGAVVVKAAVKVTNQDTGETRSVETQSDGSYRIDAISPGLYTVAVTLQGFEPVTITNLAVRASVVTSYDPRLIVGKVNAAVTIEATMNTINTENGALSGTIGTTELTNVPIFSLNPVELATTVPGVQIVMAAGNSNGQNIEVNGLRPRDNNFLIDGQDINDNSIAGQAVQPNIPDMFSEVSVLTNSSSAEFGRGGGAVVNLITKSGTNHFHGSAWELYSGSGLSALNGQLRQSKPIAAGAPNPKARTNTHRYGFTIGGPIIKNRLFAFGASQWVRVYGKETPSRLTIPDANGFAILNKVGGPRVALLDQYLAGLVGTDPSSGPVSSQDLGSRPACNPNCVVTYGYYTRPAPSQQNTNTQWTYKVDFNLTTNDTFAFRYLHTRNLLTPDFFNFPASLPGLDTNQGGPSEQFGATYTHVFTPNLLNEFRASETRIDFRFNITPQALANPLFPLPTLTVGVLPSLGVSSAIPQGRGHDIYQFQDTIAWTHGRHTLRFGADVGRLIVRDFIPFNSRGTITYTAGGSTSILANYIDDYSGASGSAAISYGSNRVDPHVWQTGYFVQDDFKATRDLTVNLGLRYEYDPNPENSLKYPGINIATVLTDPFNAVIKVKEDRNNIAPRVGFAFAPHSIGKGMFGNGKSVVRGGIGIFYDTVFTNITDNSQAASPNANAVLSQITTGRGTANVSTAITSIPNVASPTNSVTSVDSNQVNPLTYQYNLGVEQELPANMKLSMFYVGTRGQKVFAQGQFNYFVNGSRLNTGRGSIAARGNYADSNYNSMQIDIDHNFHRGIFVRGAYTYGKALDDATDVFTQFDTNTVYPANLAPGGIHAEWARSAFDHRHYLSMVYVWAIPGAHEGFLRYLTNNWTVSGISQFQTGPAGSAGISSFDTNGDGQLNDRPTLGNPNAPLNTLGQAGNYITATPNCFGSGTVTYSANVIYDITAVQSCTKTGTGYVTSYQPVSSNSVHWIIAPGSGNVRRNTIPDPGTMINNVSLQKDIPLSFINHHFEGHALQFRFEAQDIANHNNVLPYNTLVNNLVGSQVNGTIFMNKSYSRNTDGRNIRFWARYSF
jgi:hypothetical protein